YRERPHPPLEHVTRHGGGHIKSAIRNPQSAITASSALHRAIALRRPVVGRRRDPPRLAEAPLLSPHPPPPCSARRANASAVARPCRVPRSSRRCRARAA